MSEPVEIDELVGELAALADAPTASPLWINVDFNELIETYGEDAWDMLARLRTMFGQR